MLKQFTAALVLLGLATQPRLLHGQQLLGTVRDSAAQQPISGAVVVTLDSLGRTVARSTTDQRGQYRLPASPAARQLRIIRIGFRPYASSLPQPATGAPVDVTLASIPFLLTQVNVTAAPSCPSRSDRAAAYALLEQVRAGLTAAVVARSQNRASMTRLLYDRLLDRSNRIVSQSVRFSSATAQAVPFGSARTGAVFVREGFRQDSAGGSNFFGPDAETLIDEEFAAGYCFHVMPADRSRPNQVGLGFEAAKHRDGRIDIAGALWTDTLARALRDLDFRYVGLDRELSALNPGGRLAFREMPNGVVLVQHWSLRLVTGRQGIAGPTLSASGMVTRSTTSQLYAAESGGELAHAKWPDGDAYAAPLGKVRLQAVTARGLPASGAIVRLADSDYEAKADSAGIAEILDLLPGPYEATIVDPRLSELDVSMPASSRFVAARDSTVDARLVVETAENLVAGRCERDGRITGGAWVLGRIVQPDGRAAKDAQWRIRDEFGSSLVEGGKVGSDGLFHWCQLPLNKRVELEVWLGERRAKATRVLTNHLTTIRFELGPG